MTAKPPSAIDRCNAVGWHHALKHNPVVLRLNATPGGTFDLDGQTCRVWTCTRCDGSFSVAIDNPQGESK